jgi:5-methylcytosine-specific restriction endonuclease McrA
MMLHVRRDWARESNWARTRTEHYEIFARDGFRCTSPGCRSRRNLQAHHIAFRSRGGSDDPSNLTTLCAACHQFALHTAQTLRVRGRAPHRLVWEMGRETGPDGHERPWRRFVGEFRREKTRR